MTEIKLTKRYPQSRTEDIVDAYMRGWNNALDAVQNGKFHIAEQTEPQRGCDADCNEDCNECARESELWRAEQTEPQKCDDCVWSVCNYNKVDWERAEQTEPQTDCGDFADRLAYERGVKHAWEVAQKVFDSTVTFYEAKDVAKQIDKDINVRGKWETPPKFEHKGVITTCVSVPAFLLKDEPQLIKDCTTCKYHEAVSVVCGRCDRHHSKYEPQTEK